MPTSPVVEPQQQIGPVSGLTEQKLRITKQMSSAEKGLMDPNTDKKTRYVYDRQLKVYLDPESQEYYEIKSKWSFIYF